MAAEPLNLPDVGDRASGMSRRQPRVTGQRQLSRAANWCSRPKPDRGNFLLD